MKINRQKRIGEVVIITEGDNPEYGIIEGIFHNFLGYTVYSKERNHEKFTELNGFDKYSKIFLFNAPTNDIKCLQDANGLNDYLYNQVAQKYDVDLINDATYIIFDRDRRNNRYTVVKKLIEVFNASQNDSEEQNGLLLLSYPSIEAFQISMFEDYAYRTTFELGSKVKDYIIEKGYGLSFNEETIKHATDEFIKYLINAQIINSEDDIFSDMGDIGQTILEKQTDLMKKAHVFNCISQLIEILLDLCIIEFE